MNTITSTNANKIILPLTPLLVWVELVFIIDMLIYVKSK